MQPQGLTPGRESLPQPCVYVCAVQVADAATLSQLHNHEGCTLQLHQPQRFFDPCWRLLAALERQLGCLVGTNA
jgi:lysine-specific demethylase/histidyl-hydroxylase NO66